MVGCPKCGAELVCLGIRPVLTPEGELEDMVIDYWCMKCGYETTVRWDDADSTEAIR